MAVRDRIGRWARLALMRALAVALVLAPLAACDAVEYLRGGLFRHVDKPVPGAEQDYPNLASVPDKPTAITPKPERVKLEQKLAADAKSAAGTAPGSGSAGGGTATTPQAGSGAETKAATASVPAAPPPLPPGFLSGQQPTKLPEPSAPPARAAATTPAPSPVPSVAPKAGAPEAADRARLPRGGPAFGALGTPRKVAIVLFAEGSAQLDPAQIDKLRPIVQQLHRRGGTLQVVGYASRDAEVGEDAADKMANFNLSLDRANAVAGALMRLGAGASEVIVSAEGDSAPVEAIAGATGSAANQRADIYLER